MLASGVNWRATVCVRAGLWQIGWRKNVSGVATAAAAADDDGYTPEVLYMYITMYAVRRRKYTQKLYSVSPPTSRYIASGRYDSNTERHTYTRTEANQRHTPGGYLIAEGSNDMQSYWNLKRVSLVFWQMWTCTKRLYTSTKFSPSASQI